MSAATLSCAGAGSERNLSPIYSSHSAASTDFAGGVPEVEALGGIGLARQHPVTGERLYWAIRPILSNRFKENRDRFAWFLPPLGFIDDRESQGRSVTQFLPLARYATNVELSGFETWSLLVLPGIYWSAHEDGRVQRAFFPFFGLVEKFLSFDRATFALFPLWLRTERYGRKTDYYLWPFFSYSRGTGGIGWRAWPIAGHNRWKGRYSRWFAAWPVLHFQRNGLQYSDEQQQKSWFVWPLIGRSRRGPASQTTVLWPFFGRTNDPETGFWAFDGPWPLVRFQGGDPERATRQRVWPFYSRYEGDDLLSRWYMWPIVNRRNETYIDGTKTSTSVFPFWRSYTRERDSIELGNVSVAPEDGPPGATRFRKLWPLGKTRSGPGGVAELTVIDLNPFQELGFVNEHYSWIWELYTRDAKEDVVRSRSWLGLWRREKDRDEDRRSLSVLWSGRDYTRAGRAARERSWLFGLIRYRSVEGKGFSLLRPAFPGPGWPMGRVPNSKPLAVVRTPAAR